MHKSSKGNLSAFHSSVWWIALQLPLLARWAGSSQQQSIPVLGEITSFRIERVWKEELIHWLAQLSQELLSLGFFVCFFLLLFFIQEQSLTNFHFSLAFKRDCFKIDVSFRPLPPSSLSLCYDRSHLRAAGSCSRPERSGWGEVLKYTDRRNALALYSAPVHMCFSFPLCFLECFYWRDREEIQHHRPGLWLVPQVAPGSQFGLGSTGRLGGMASRCAGALCTGGECHYCIPHLLPAVLVHGQASFSKCMKPGRRWVAKPPSSTLHGAQEGRCSCLPPSAFTAGLHLALHIVQKEMDIRTAFLFLLL